MEKVCFVVMPFGGQFDEIYRRIYIPVIRKAGLDPAGLMIFMITGLSYKTSGTQFRM